jgi:UDP-glucose 6-dehydrogenase
MRVGVVGLGVVGGSTFQVLRRRLEGTVSYDTNGSGSCSSLAELADAVDIAVVCVPTPPGLVNRLDTSIVAAVCKAVQNVQVTVVRSTVPIGTCRTLPGNVVYWPEFCNARSALQDILLARHAFLGGPRELTDQIAYLGTQADLWKQPHLGRWEDVEALKLVTNAAMAVKVAFANEAKAVVEKHGGTWAQVAKLLAFDHRLGAIGWQVPGPDGLPGFGGACLPKDLAGFCAQADDVHVPTEVATAARRVNKKVRPKEPKPCPPSA